MFKSLELFELIDISLKNDIEFVKELMDSCSGYLFQYLLDDLRNNKQVYQYAVKRSGFEYVFNRLLKEAIGDDNLDIERLKNLEEPIRDFLASISITEYAGSEILMDKESILIAIERDPLTFQFLNDDMKSDYDIIKKALSFGSLNMRHINKKEIKKSKFEILKEQYFEILKKDPYQLEYAPKELLSDKDIIRTAIVKKWYEYFQEWGEHSELFDVLSVFQYADETIRNDKEFVKELLESCGGYLFEFLPESSRNDEEIYLMALHRCGWDYVNERLYKETQTCSEEDYEDCYYEYQSDRKFDFKIHFTNYKGITRHAGQNILMNKKLMLNALEYEPDEFHYMHETLKDDKEVALAAVYENTLNYSDVSERLRDDLDVALKAIHGNGYWFDYLRGAESIWGQIDSYVFEYMSERIRNNREVYIKIIKDCYEGEQVIEFLPEQLKNDKEIIMMALRKDYKLIEFVTEKLQNDKDIIALEN